MEGRWGVTVLTSRDGLDMVVRTGGLLWTGVRQMGPNHPHKTVGSYGPVRGK